MSDLLLEIGVEELPAGYIGPALEALRAGLIARLAERGCEVAADAVQSTGTPRRLILWAHALPEASPKRSERLQGPPADRAFDPEGKPTKAAEGFAKKCGVPVERLRVEDKYVVAEVSRGGEKIDELLVAELPALIGALPFPKSMRWVPGSRVAFARPVRYILCLLGSDVLPVKFADVVAGRTSRGHAFHAPEQFSVRAAKYFEFVEVLRGRKVLADVEDRRRQVRLCAEKGAEKSGGRLYNRGGISDRLVEEVANLVEWPGAIFGTFDDGLCRELPAEVIVAAQTLHQRYFPVEDASGQLLPKFVAIANRDPRSGGKASVIRAGNERVLRARLADALFFWREDKKAPLEARLPALEGVRFHEKLGSMRQKSERCAALARWLAEQSNQEPIVIQFAERAALLSKCDLVTKVVFEFPELQGVMGRYLAREGGEPDSVGKAIEEHYLPRTAAMELPRSPVGRLAALAEKFDSLVGGFAAGLAPTGSKDPYALRRATIGAIAIVRDGKLFSKGPGLRAVLGKALELYRGQGRLKDCGDEPVKRVLDYFRDRLEGALLEEAGGVEVLRAVLSAGFDNLAELDARVAAVAGLARRPDFGALCTVVERARNIVRKSPAAAAQASAPSEADLQAPEEKELARALAATEPRFREKLAAGNYYEASELYLSSFARPLHEFFEKVFVNVEDAALRDRRLALLGAIHRLYAESIADLAECAGQAKG